MTAGGTARDGLGVNLAHATVLQAPLAGLLGCSLS
jgi:hypothetical protein